MISTDFTEKSYYKEKAHNTMTEDFVISLPKEINRESHERAMAKSFSESSRFAEMNLEYSSPMF